MSFWPYRSIDSGMQLLLRHEDFWNTDPEWDFRQVLSYSLFFAFFPFAGYLFTYTVRGKIWSLWPFIHTTLDIGSALIFAGLQWIFFGLFPVLGALILEKISAKSESSGDFYEHAAVQAYSLTPLCLSALFVGVPFFDRIATTLGFATTLFLLYFGFRLRFRYTILRSVLLVGAFLILFIGVRQMFVFAIGF